MDWEQLEKNPERAASWKPETLAAGHSEKYAGGIKRGTKDGDRITSDCSLIRPACFVSVVVRFKVNVVVEIGPGNQKGSRRSF